MKHTPKMYIDVFEQEPAEITGRSTAKQKARELAAIAASSNYPVTVLPPQPIPKTRPGHRGFSKASPHVIKEQPIPEFQKKIQSRYLTKPNAIPREDN